jgi:nitrate reductase beta subunit
MIMTQVEKQVEVEKQVAMVMDLNKCIGCQTCTIACKTLWSNDEGMEYM